MHQRERQWPPAYAPCEVRYEYEQAHAFCHPMAPSDSLTAPALRSIVSYSHSLLPQQKKDLKPSRDSNSRKELRRNGRQSRPFLLPFGPHRCLRCDSLYTVKDGFHIWPCVPVLRVMGTEFIEWNPWQERDVSFLLGLERTESATRGSFLATPVSQVAVLMGLAPVFLISILLPFLLSAFCCSVIARLFRPFSYPVCEPLRRRIQQANLIAP